METGLWFKRPQFLWLFPVRVTLGGNYGRDYTSVHCTRSVIRRMRRGMAVTRLMRRYMAVTRHCRLLYPEWPHRQCVGLAIRRSYVRGWLSAASLVICSPASIAVCNTWSSGGTALCRVGGATSQFCGWSHQLRPLSVAGCGWLQLGAPHLATSVKLLQVVDNWTHILW